MVHPSLVKSFEEHRTSVSVAKRSGSINQSEPKRIKMETPSVADHVDSNRGKSITQNQVDKLIMQYVVWEMRPLVTVEKPAFKAFVEGLSGNKKVVSQNAFK
jgi:hypothetical protein